MKHLVLAAALLLPVANVDEPLLGGTIHVKEVCLTVEIFDKVTELHTAGKWQESRKLFMQAGQLGMCINTRFDPRAYIEFKPKRVVRRYPDGSAPRTGATMIVEGEAMGSTGFPNIKAWIWVSASELDRLKGNTEKSNSNNKPEPLRPGEQEA